jgi:hypothetical protein
MAKQVAPYGSWRSPITSDLIVSETIGLGSITVDRNDILWLETRPREAGRNVIVRRNAGGHVQDVTPTPFSARTSMAVVPLSSSMASCTSQTTLTNGYTGNRTRGNHKLLHRRGRYAMPMA